MELKYERIIECLAKFDLSLSSVEENQEATEHRQEIYLTIMNDRRIRKPVLIASLERNIDFETKSLHSSGLLISEAVDPLWGIRNYQVTNISSELNLPRESWGHFEWLTSKFFQVYLYFDCTFAKLSLTLDLENYFTLTHCQMIIDSNALFRHPEFQKEINGTSDWKLIGQNSTYLKFDGQIGCIVNGAGLAMAVMDMIYHFSENRVHPANFLDICGVVTVETIAESVLLLSSDINIKAILVNIFGGMTRCDEVAQGIVMACRSVLVSTPIIVRLEGNNAQKGREIIMNAQLDNLELANSLTEVVKKSIYKIENN